MNVNCLNDSNVLRAASFHYALAHVDLNIERLCFDEKESLFRNLPTSHKQHGIRKVSLQEIISECKSFTKFRDPFQVNLLLIVPMTTNLQQLAHRANQSFARRSLIGRIMIKTHNLAFCGTFAKTSDILCQMHGVIIDHSYYLLGKRFDFLLHPEANPSVEEKHG